MLIPYQVDVPMERWPYANWVLIAVTSVISFVICIGYLLGAGELTPDEELQLVQRIERENPNAGPGELDRKIEAAKEDAEMMPGALWRKNFRFYNLFTHLFVHADPLHLIGNMIFLFVFGNAVNAKLGHAQFLVCYFLIGAITGAAWLAFGNGMPLVGASGAIMGLIGIFAVFFPRNDVSVLYWITLAVSGEFTISSYWLILFYFLGDLFGTLIQHLSGVAYICHVVGAMVGFCLALALVALGFYPATRYEENLLQFIGMQEKTTKKKKKKKKRVRAEED
jgi:membrane associated rhomboid family serine protease